MPDNVGTDVQVVDAAAAAKTEVVTPVFQTVEEALVALKAKEEEVLTLSRNLEQSRKEEKFNKNEAKRLKDEYDKLMSNDALAELQGKYEEEVKTRTELQTKIRNKMIDAALENALKDAKAKSVSTVMKLINRDEIVVEDDTVDAKSIEAIIEKLRTEDSVLFDAPATPSVARAAEGAEIGSFQKEIQAAKSQKEIEAIMRRYGKL